MMMIIRHRLFVNITRTYHDSNFKEKLPVVRYARTRDNKQFRDRNQTSTAVNTYPPRVFEPFPYAVTEENKVQLVRRCVTPFFDIPYEEQLDSKLRVAKASLRLLAQQLYKLATPVRLDVSKLPCRVNPIVASPLIEKYRNHDEFSIWRGVDGKTSTVGFMVFPISKHGDTVCVEPNHCHNLKDESKKVADILQHFIRHEAQLPVCYHLDTGGWRRFVVKNNQDGELMVIGHASPRGMTLRQMMTDRDKFRDVLVSQCQESGLKLKSLYFQPCPHNKCLDRNVPYELLYGEPTIKERVNNYEFFMSPESNFHSNTTGAEVLYRTIRKILEDSEESLSNTKPLILDANCSAGVLSVHLADLASRVVGVDISSKSIEDARANASHNGIKNCEFICSQLEISLERILDKYSRHKRDTTVVVQAKTSGVHPNIVKALRECYDIKKLIYITSNPEKPGIIDNLITLCKTERGRSVAPFVPMIATPVDVYPHVKNCELVLSLERAPH